MFKFLKKIFGFGSAKTLSSSESKEFLGHLKKAQSLGAKEQIMEYDKIYHHILQALGYQGSFGEILKQEPPEIHNLQAIWKLHKLRNSLVHDLRDFDERYIVKQAREYKTIDEKFVKQLTKK